MTGAVLNGLGTPRSTVAPFGIRPALGMNHHLGSRVSSSLPVHIINPYLHVSRAISGPEMHVSTGLVHGVMTEILVGDEKNGAVFGCLFYDAGGVA